MSDAATITASEVQYLKWDSYGLQSRAVLRGYGLYYAMQRANALKI